MDYIAPVKEQLDNKLHELCRNFLKMNQKPRVASPRWLNFSAHHREKATVVIRSTNAPISFQLIYPKQIRMDVTEYWEQFKKYRTKFLIENYPQINPF